MILLKTQRTVRNVYLNADFYLLLASALDTDVK